MGKVLTFKKIPQCPAIKTGGIQMSCLHQGLVIDDASNDKAFKIATILHKNHHKLRMSPVEYSIIDTNTILAALPLTANPDVLMCEISNLHIALTKSSQRMVEQEIPCFLLTVFYNNLYDNLFVLTEDLHKDE